MGNSRGKTNAAARSNSPNPLIAQTTPGLKIGHKGNIETDEATGFRNGERNLHWVHVNKKTKGRTCRTCHEVHASKRPRLVAESVPFGKRGWRLPLNFEKTETGGSCQPGCHRAYG